MPEKTKEQEEYDKWFESLPELAEDLLQELETKVGLFSTFDLLSNVSLYNHIHDAESYSDYREDRMFVVSELITMIALKKPFVKSSIVELPEYEVRLKEIQEMGLQYFSWMTMIHLRTTDPIYGSEISSIADRNKRDETIIRNPALPEHHFMLSKELYSPLDSEIKAHFGFSVTESLEIRSAIVALINIRWKEARELAERKALNMIMEVSNYRAKKQVKENSLLSENELQKLNQLSRKNLKHTCFKNCISEMYYRFGEIYCFSSQDLATFMNIDVLIVERFFKNFSCGFPSLDVLDSLYGPTSLLKTKPLVIHDGLALVPSMPLVTWCVEPVIDEFIKSSQKLLDKFKSIRHDVLLKKGVECFSKILRSDDAIYTNLFYFKNKDYKNRYETDGIFRYKRTLFIIEAKGNRISQAAKEGKIKRTEKHLKEIVKNSYEQGLRTYDFICSTSVAEFQTENNHKVLFRKCDFDEVIIVSLTLETIGNVTPLIKVSNELGYFRKGIFPWIISIYDLLVIADHFEIPALLPHYIKRRKEFLEKKIMNVFEETDLMSYYLNNRLYIEQLYKNAENEGAQMVYMENNTDAINNYYMHKYNLRTVDPPKLRLNFPSVLIKLLDSLETSSSIDSQKIMQYVLDLSPDAVLKFSNYIDRIRSYFLKDKKVHDCSITNRIWDKTVGITYIIGDNKIDVDGILYMYCKQKIQKVNADIWIGLGQIGLVQEECTIQTAFIIQNFVEEAL